MPALCVMSVHYLEIFDESEFGPHFSLELTSELSSKGLAVRSHSINCFVSSNWMPYMLTISLSTLEYRL